MNCSVFKLSAVTLVLLLVVFLPLQSFGENAAESYFSRATKYMEKGAYDKAIVNFTKALKINPNLAEAYYNLGLIYGKEKHDFDNAIAGFSRAIQINPGYAEAHNNLGQAYLIGKHDYDKAIAEYSEAVKINPNYAEAYYNRGVAYYEGKHDNDKAVNEYSEAIKINPNFAAAYYNRGIVLMSIGDKASGCRDINHACELGMCQYAQYAKSTGDCK
ncbi:MAG: tetratricopeptide repeat protein [Nitrospirae bacterium]|nr:tetratricopeptide repeat protein [Nitrospirota bacterium]